ncbi:MAG: hypothetical protein IPK97_10315 [Ahniella sp.]|nr:hypothetical protein [Ahniella sp.]
MDAWKESATNEAASLRPPGRAAIKLPKSPGRVTTGQYESGNLAFPQIDHPFRDPMHPIPKASGLAAAIVLLMAGSAAVAAPFTPGNLVVARVGNGAAILSNASTAVFLDEYTTAGTLVQSIALPTAASGANRALTIGGTGTSEGMVSRSVDNRYVTMSGYDIPPGTASVNGTPTATVNRVVARIDSTGLIDTTTGFTTAFNANSVRAATTVDGTDIWVSGVGASSLGGVWHRVCGSIAAGTQISTTVTNTRNLGIAGGQLYVTSGSGAFRLATVGTLTPTTAGQTITNLSGLPTGPLRLTRFVFLDRDAGVGGNDTRLFLGRCSRWRHSQVFV